MNYVNLWKVIVLAEMKGVKLKMENIIPEIVVSCDEVSFGED